MQGVRADGRASVGDAAMRLFWAGVLVSVVICVAEFLFHTWQDVREHCRRRGYEE